MDLNCDLGEGEPLTRTRALMRWITSANVACGGHAGDALSMQACVRFAKQFGVRLGAHPGAWSRGDFGRTPVALTPEALELLLLQQVSALERMARTASLRLHHIKLHGALYHATDADAGLAQRYLAVVRRWWPGAKIYTQAGRRLAQLARRHGVAVWEEAFADRGYRNDGTLVPRNEPNALLTQVEVVVQRVRLLRSQSEIRTISGQPLRLHPRTLCVHSDTPNAIRIVRAIRENL